MTDVAQLLVSPDSSLREAMACIDRNAEGVVVVVDEDRRLIGTVTDGDIRRAILARTNLDEPVRLLLDRKASTQFPAPISAQFGTSDADLLRLMNQHSIRQVPLLDEGLRVVDVALLSNLAKEYEHPMTAVVMAGGLGTRLRPLTDDLPKPMLPVRDRPLLELIVEQLREAGIRRLNVTTHYKADSISSYFGDGQKFGVEIQYVQEDQPLGTAGALSLIEAPPDPLFVINGDILTRIDFRAMLEFHREHSAHMTVAVKEYELPIPYGVMEIDGIEVKGIVEKPVVSQFINAGIYLLNPEVCRLIPSGEPYDMPRLITRVLDEGQRVVGFPITEYWLDVGRHEDYELAQGDLQAGSP